MPKALIVVPAEGFSDREYLELRARLEHAGIAVDLASTEREVKASGGARLMASVLLSEVRSQDYQAVVFLGGKGVPSLVEVPAAIDLARSVHQAGGVVAAGRTAVLILARAGLLEGRRVTGPLSLAEQIRAAGATYTAAEVEVDNRIITQRRPKGFKHFAGAVVAALRQPVGA